MFEIESIFGIKARDRIIIMARRLDDKPFKMSSNSLLNNIPIEEYVDMPRAHDKEGNARFDLFCFILKDNKDKDKFHEGQVVELFN